ncbi:hypothetical protein D3C76_23690 [compost metagenome]
MATETLERGQIRIEEQEVPQITNDINECNAPCPHCTTSYNGCTMNPNHYGSHRCANGHTY